MQSYFTETDPTELLGKALSFLSSNKFKGNHPGLERVLFWIDERNDHLAELQGGVFEL